jgi:hypothetical protein
MHCGENIVNLVKEWLFLEQKAWKLHTQKSSGSQSCELFYNSFLALCG